MRRWQALEFLFVDFFKTLIQTAYLKMWLGAEGIFTLDQWWQWSNEGREQNSKPILVDK